MYEVLESMSSHLPVVTILVFLVFYLRQSVRRERIRIERVEKLSFLDKINAESSSQKGMSIHPGVRKVSFFEAKCCDCEDELYMEEEVEAEDIPSYLQGEDWQELDGELYCEICIDRAYQKKRELLLMASQLNERKNGQY
jgi:hypothetical protein